MNIYRLKACRKCGGDLARDDGDWRCLQCGSYSYVGLYRNPLPPVIRARESAPTFMTTEGASDPPVQCGMGLTGRHDAFWRSPLFVSGRAGEPAPVES